MKNFEKINLDKFKLNEEQLFSTVGGLSAGGVETTTTYRDANGVVTGTITCADCDPCSTVVSRTAVLSRM